VLEPVIKAGERLNLSNGGDRLALAIVTTTTTMVAKDGGGGSSKKPRGPGVLLEGSRCSRKNGRGWRCSQPTMVGYALCQYHLGKGRMRSAAAAAAARAAAGQLGRTENGKKAPAAAAAATATITATAAPPKAADVPPASVQHC
jgi:hypothetical protein